MMNLKLVRYLVLLIYVVNVVRGEVATHKTRVKRVVNGFDASDDSSINYQFLLSLKYAKDSTHLCGASRLSNRWAITAAHCVLGLKSTQLYAVTADNTSITIDSIIQHVFNPVNYFNDIALLKLKTRHNAHTSVIKLPSRPVRPNDECIILGEGSTFFAGPNSDSVQAGYVDVISYEDCLSALGRVMTPHKESGMFCAGGKTAVDSCNGDSGGPIICKNNKGVYKLSGIISYGIGCGTLGIPGVYTDSYHHLKWIYKTLKEC